MEAVDVCEDEVAERGEFCLDARKTLQNILAGVFCTLLEQGLLLGVETLQQVVHLDAEVALVCLGGHTAPANGGPAQEAFAV